MRLAALVGLLLVPALAFAEVTVTVDVTRARLYPESEAALRGQLQAAGDAAAKAHPLEGLKAELLVEAKFGKAGYSAVVTVRAAKERVLATNTVKAKSSNELGNLAVPAIEKTLARAEKKALKK
jgi:hypothetical protein